MLMFLFEPLGSVHSTCILLFLSVIFTIYFLITIYFLRFKKKMLDCFLFDYLFVCFLGSRVLSRRTFPTHSLHLLSFSPQKYRFDDVNPPNPDRAKSEAVSRGFIDHAECMMQRTQIKENRFLYPICHSSCHFQQQGTPAIRVLVQAPSSCCFIVSSLAPVCRLIVRASFQTR